MRLQVGLKGGGRGGRALGLQFGPGIRVLRDPHIP